MSNKIFIVLSIVIILSISIFMGLFIAKQIISVPTNCNETLNNIAEVSKGNEEKQEKINFISYLYDKDNPIEYIITDQEKIKEIKDDRNRSKHR